jgi:hypothetical protein
MPLALLLFAAYRSSYGARTHAIELAADARLNSSVH